MSVRVFYCKHRQWQAAQQSWSGAVTEQVTGRLQFMFTVWAPNERFARRSIVSETVYCDRALGGGGGGGSARSAVWHL
jgi:hypothetical protein